VVSGLQLVGDKACLGRSCQGWLGPRS